MNRILSNKKLLIGIVVALVVIAIVFILIFTNKNSNAENSIGLVCEKNEDGAELLVTAKKHEDRYVYYLDSKYDFSQYDETNKKLLLSRLTAFYSYFNGISGFDYSIKENETNVETNIVIDFYKLSLDDYISETFGYLNASLDELENGLKAEGFVCKKH